MSRSHSRNSAMVVGLCSPEEVVVFGFLSLLSLLPGSVLGLSLSWCCFVCVCVCVCLRADVGLQAAVGPLMPRVENGSGFRSKKTTNRSDILLGSK